MAGDVTTTGTRAAPRLADVVEAYGEMYVILSTAAYPMQGREYICCQLRRGEAQPGSLPIGPEKWTWSRTNAPVDLHADPRTIHTVHGRAVTRVHGELDAHFVLDIRLIVKSYI